MTLEPIDIADGVCPTRLVLDRIADKWTVFILCLLTRRPMRFNELRKNISGLSQKVLTQTLRNLQADGIVARTEIAATPRMVEYRLTPLGESLWCEALSGIRHWATRNMAAIMAAREGA